jgi:hypothetical protein
MHANFISNRWPEELQQNEWQDVYTIIHELVCAFLDVSGAKNKANAIPSFTTGNVLIFRQALYKDGAAKITKDLRLHVTKPGGIREWDRGYVGHDKDGGK